MDDVKRRIRTAQLKASLSVNRELIQLYWSVGKDIIERQKSAGWGKSIVDRLAVDLQREFPGLTGFSPRNVWRMRAFYEAWTREVLILPQPVAELDGVNLPLAVAEIPWGHNIWLMEKVKDPRHRAWYAAQVVAHGWSRDVLALQIETGLHKRQGRAITNFKRALPPAQSDLAQQALKDPYVFDFLTIHPATQERDIENDLVNHVTKFLLELGAGFAFVGRQYLLNVDGEEYRIDLLFYHLRLHCYVVVELKAGAFKPEYAGKLNFYLSAVDAQLRAPVDNASIGLILCREKSHITAEYSLRDMAKPMGVAEYKITDSLPKKFKGKLPAIVELEKELKDTR